MFPGHDSTFGVRPPRTPPSRACSGVPHRHTSTVIGIGITPAGAGEEASAKRLSVISRNQVEPQTGQHWTGGRRGESLDCVLGMEVPVSGSGPGKGKPVAPGEEGIGA